MSKKIPTVGERLTIVGRQPGSNAPIVRQGSGDDAKYKTIPEAQVRGSLNSGNELIHTNIGINGTLLDMDVYIEITEN